MCWLISPGDVQTINLQTRLPPTSFIFIIGACLARNDRFVRTQGLGTHGQINGVTTLVELRCPARARSGEPCCASAVLVSLLALERFGLQGADVRSAFHIPLYRGDREGASYQPRSRRLLLDFGAIGLAKTDNLTAMVGERGYPIVTAARY